MDRHDKILVLGATGMVGTAIFKNLDKNGYNVFAPNRQVYNLLNYNRTLECFYHYQPDYVFLCAALVGGIHANNIYPADFIYKNLMIQNNVINESKQHGVKKLLFLGSSCIYPKNCSQPIQEEYLLTGALEPTNDAYAIAKIAGIKMCQAYRKQYGCNFISVMPTNLYGDGDRYDLQNGHVMAALIKKFIDAKKNNWPSVEVWGTGTPRREFLHVDDLAEACVFLMNNYNDPEPINIGTGEDLTIMELALMIKEIVGYEGEITLNSDYPDGTMRKLLDVSKIHNLGWRHKIELKEGLTLLINKLVDQNNF